jgi:AcrR family transcriptional regulator
MDVRGKAAERTAEKIQDAAIGLFRSRPFSEVTLQAIAAKAGVTLQTVLRRFGSKEQVFTEAAKRHMTSIFGAREVSAPGDIATIVATIVASYEDMGDLNWRGVTQEDQFPLIKQVFDQARANHREWIGACFEGLIRPARGWERERRVDLLFAATDFYLWKLFRRDLGRSRALTTAHMCDLVTALAQLWGGENGEISVRDGRRRG